jgi:hypothetical protein
MSDGSGIFHTNAEGVFMSLELQSAMLLLVSLGLLFGIIWQVRFCHVVAGAPILRRAYLHGRVLVSVFACACTLLIALVKLHVAISH